MAKPIVNRKASFDYSLGEKFEAGIVLTGDEIKSARVGQISLVDSFVQIREGEAFLLNAHIGVYGKGEKVTDSRRTRKLLLNKREIDYLNGKVAGSNLTIVPIRLYFKHNYAKMEIALAQGKKKWDKRESLRRKAQERDAESLLRKDKLEYQKEQEKKK
jgi:SsrA-binding protein